MTERNTAKAMARDFVRAWVVSFLVLLVLFG